MAAAKLTIEQTARAFGVSTMTLWLWRKGTPTKTAIPHDTEMEGNKERVYFAPKDCRPWAKEHGLAFNLSAAGGPGPNDRPGPKPKAKKAARKRVKH